MRGAALQRGSGALGAGGAAAAWALARARVGYADSRQTRRGQGREALVLLKMNLEGLRWEGRARRRAAALGSMWLDFATTLVMAAL